MESLEKSEETVSNVTPRMNGTVNWGTATVIGIFAGMLYGGSKEASASVSKDAEVMLKLGSTPDKREQHRLMRDAMEKRFVSARITPLACKKCTFGISSGCSLLLPSWLAPVEACRESK